jgi:transposase-like protein
MCIFSENALDYVPRKVDDDCLQERRWFYDRRDLAEVRRDIAAGSRDGLRGLHFGHVLALRCQNKDI